MDETLCATSQADKAAGQNLLPGFNKRIHKSLILKHSYNATCKGYIKAQRRVSQLVALLPDENAFRCGLIQTILAEDGIHIDAEQAQQAQHYFDSARIGAFTFFLA